jgi:hypothetical protein
VRRHGNLDILVREQSGSWFSPEIAAIACFASFWTDVFNNFARGVGRSGISRPAAAVLFVLVIAAVAIYDHGGFAFLG